MSFQRFCFFCLGCKSKRIRWHHFLILLPFQDKCIKGFRLAYQLAPCSRTYSQPHGRVLSPSWPHRLPRHCNLLHPDLHNNSSILRNLTCSFKITAPTGRYISVYFRYLAISPSPNCSSSHLEVRDYRVSFAQHQVKGSRWRQ